MKKIYNTYISFLESLPRRHQFFKMLIAEKIALRKKQQLVKTIVWDEDEDKRFDFFWRKNYKKITDKGHKLFQYFNGVFHEDYMPDFLYATEVETKMNSYNYAKVYSDKSLTEVLYKNKSNALLPTTYLLNVNGVYYDCNRNIVDKESARTILLSLNEAVIKPILDGNSGKGVIVGVFDDNGYDSEHKFNIMSLLETDHLNYIVQEKIIQSRDLNSLFPNSINTFRVITYIVNSRIKIAPVSLRMGTGKSKLDNIHAGGLVVGVDMENEVLLKMAYKLGYSNSDLKYDTHPDTNTVFHNYKISGVKSILDAAIKLHGQTPHIGIISWDFTLNHENVPVLIEANYIGQSVWFPQIVNSAPIFNDDTKEILNFIRNERAN